jgi:hypothetical protein
MGERWASSLAAVSAPVLEHTMERALVRELAWVSVRASERGWVSRWESRSAG